MKKISWLIDWFTNKHYPMVFGPSQYIIILKKWKKHTQNLKKNIKTCSHRRSTRHPPPVWEIISTSPQRQCSKRFVSGGQRSRSQEAEVRFGGPAEASFSMPLSRVSFLFLKYGLMHGCWPAFYNSGGILVLVLQVCHVRMTVLSVLPFSRRLCSCFVLLPYD